MKKMIFLTALIFACGAKSADLQEFSPSDFPSGFTKRLDQNGNSIDCFKRGMQIMLTQYEANIDSPTYKDELLAPVKLKALWTAQEDYYTVSYFEGAKFKIMKEDPVAEEEFKKLANTFLALYNKNDH